jgi:hypothetical protein
MLFTMFLQARRDVDEESVLERVLNVENEGGLIVVA